MSCGNGEYAGDGYVCFTYDHGTYITGFYCEYHLDESTINMKSVSGEEFQKQFNNYELTELCRIYFSNVNIENEILPAGTNEWIAIDELDFGLIEW